MNRPTSDRFTDRLCGFILGILCVILANGIESRIRRVAEPQQLADAVVHSGSGQFWVKAYQGPDSLKIVTGSDDGERLFVSVENEGFRLYLAIGDQRFPMELKPKKKD